MLGKRYISFDTEYLLPSSGHRAELHFLYTVCAFHTLVA